MTGQRGFWDIKHRLEELSREGDPLEKLVATVDFEMFRPILLRALRRGRKRRGPGGRPPYDPVLKFKACLRESGDAGAAGAVRIVAGADVVSGAGSAELDALLRPRAWRSGTGREHAVGLLISVGALEQLFERLNAVIEQAGYLEMGGQIVDASIVEAPKQHNTKEEQPDIKAGRVPKAWRDKQHRLRQKDMDALDAETRAGAG